MHKYTFTMFLSTSFAFLAKLLHQFLNPPVQIRFSSSNCNYLCTLYYYFSNFIYVWFKDTLSIHDFPPFPHFTFPPKMPFTCPEYLIEYSWHGQTFRFVCLICSWKLLLAFLSIAPCMSGNVFQENAKSLCHSPVNKIFAFPFAKRPKKFSLSVGR